MNSTQGPPLPIHIHGVWPIYDIAVIQDFSNPQVASPGSPNVAAGMVRVHMDVPVGSVTPVGAPPGTNAPGLPLIAAALAVGDLNTAYGYVMQAIAGTTAKPGALEVLKAAFKQP